MIEKDVRLAMFANELADIKDKDLKILAEELITNADDYFFTVAASTSGKYHPQFDLGNGGLARHTRCVVFFAECLATSSMYSEHDKDLLIVSALAHDIKKLGNDGSAHTVGNHPELAAKYVKEIAEKIDSKVPAVDIETIAGMVHSHMGQWGQRDRMPLPKTTLEITLQNADYIASRKEILDFDFKEAGAAPVIEEQASVPAFNGDPKDYVITFGTKHKGHTLEQIYKSGDDYLQWIAKKDDFFNKDAQDMVRAYLAQVAKPTTTKVENDDEKINLPF